MRPEEYKFNQRLIREFDELSDLKHKINDTFDIISDKNPQVTQLQTLQRFENKILESCKTCESQKGQTAIRDILAMKNKAEDNIHIHERLQTGDEEGTLRFSPFGDERLNTGPDKTQRVSLSPIKFDSKRTEDEKSPSNIKKLFMSSRLPSSSQKTEITRN